MDKTNSMEVVVTLQVENRCDPEAFKAEIYHRLAGWTPLTGHIIVKHIQRTDIAPDPFNLPTNGPVL